jgi:hypothetical protein
MKMKFLLRAAAVRDKFNTRKMNLFYIHSLSLMSNNEICEIILIANYAENEIFYAQLMSVINKIVQ